MNLDTLSPELKTALQDIVEHVQFDSNFRITHSNYEPLELEPKVLQRIHPLPVEVKRQYLSIQLRIFLHSIYWNGARPAWSNSAKTPDKARENDAVNPINLPFYQQLHANNCGCGYFDPGWVVLGEAGNGVIAVQKDNLTLYIHQNHHLRSPNPAPSTGDIIEILLPSNRVEQGLYIAIGNEGLADLSRAENPAQLVNLYFNLTSEGAVAIMRALTQELNEIPIPFMFKAGYNETDYDRYDTGVLCILKQSYQSIESFLSALYVSNRTYFRAPNPLFTKTLAPGLGLAEVGKPQFKLSSQDNFDINCCDILANALLEASEQNKDTPGERMRYIIENFSNAGIDLRFPYLSSESEDIFNPLPLPV